MLIAVDPGLHHCGVAYFVGGRLVRASLVRNPDSVSGMGARAARPMARAVLDDTIAMLPRRVEAVVLELPQVYPGGRGGNPGDLIDLAGVVGGVAALLPTADVTFYRPPVWKGNVPKDIMERRTVAALDDTERAAMPGPAACPPSLLHNVWDAVALGLYHVHKTGARPRKEAGR